MHQLNLELLNLTLPYIGRADQVQGPGGNTSVKDGAGRMMVKASGFRFEEIDDTKGFSIVNARNIKDYFYSAAFSDKENEEKQSVALILDNVLNDANGKPYPKPSMETGFHAVLDKYVVHTHSVWSNLVNCHVDSALLIENLKTRSGLRIVNIPYISPGFGLSYLITKQLKDAQQRKEENPSVFFLANHGIIAHGTSMEEVQDILKSVDRLIMESFSLGPEYPPTDINEDADKSYLPSNSYVKDQISFHHADMKFFEQVLFPDQTVFFKDNISIGSSEPGKKIRIDEKGAVSYHTNYREAKSMHETMTAYLFIYDTILKSAGKLKFIPSDELDYINSMDMEKHRKSIMDQ
jgi:ribulose-5-phosphate 4-epimerase/fuculose-1-phosphate aldolase